MFYPQPVPISHPHLMKNDEVSKYITLPLNHYFNYIKLPQVTPLITQDEYRARRSNLMREIFQLCDRSKGNIVILQSASKVYMSDKIPYVYRQNSDFFYLTGCLEPDVFLVITSHPRMDNFEATLFIPKTDLNASILYKI